MYIHITAKFSIYRFEYDFELLKSTVEDFSKNFKIWYLLNIEI